MLNKYGDFNDTGDRFIINTLDIERNWYNYFYTDNYISFTSQVGIGQGFLQDRLGNRITPVASRGVYAAVGEKGWNLAGLPVNDKDKSYKCEHGLGYTVISLTKNEIATDYGIFVPNENSKTDGYEVIWVTAKNTSRQNKSVKIMVYADNYLDGGYTYQGYNIGSVDYTGKVNGIHYGHERDNWNGKKQHFESFIVCGQPLSGYDCAKMRLSDRTARLQSRRRSITAAVQTAPALPKSSVLPCRRRLSLLRMRKRQLLSFSEWLKAVTK